ncbi:hypothetical protein ACOMHN_047284 [Nucella lapillus]
MGLTTLPPLKAVRVPHVLMAQQQQQQQHGKRKAKTSKHHYLLKMRREDSQRMRRLGSGLLEHEELDSAILTHLVSLLEWQRGRPLLLRSRSRGGAGVGVGKTEDTRRPPSLAIPAGKTHAGSQTSAREEEGAGGGTPGAGPGQAMSTDSSSVSSVPQLPPISRHHPLPPIKDDGREESRQTPTLSLPAARAGEAGGAPSVHVLPATPQHSTLTQLPSLRSLHDTERSMSEASGYNMSSDSSVTADPALIFGQRSSRKAKTYANRRQYGARRQSGSSVESPPLRGSLVMAPDGEIIHVGGTIPPPPQHEAGAVRDLASHFRHYDGGMVTDDSGMSDEDVEWRRSGRSRQLKSHSPRKVAAAKKGNEKAGGRGLTEQDIVDTITEQAKLIADALLDTEGSGDHLDTDIREAADMWTEAHPAHPAHPAQDTSPRPSLPHALHTEALEQLVAAYRDSSADPTAAEYRDLIRQSLIVAVAQAAGLAPEEIPEDLELSPELLEALTSQTLTPDQLTIAYDQETGRPVIRATLDPLTAQGDHAVLPDLSTSQQDVAVTADGGLPLTSAPGGVAPSQLPDPVGSSLSPGLGYDHQQVLDTPGVAAAVLRDDQQSDKPALLLGDLASAGTADHKARLPKSTRATPHPEGKSKKPSKSKDPGRSSSKKKGKKGKRGGRKEEDSGPETEGATTEAVTTPPPGVTKAGGEAADLSPSDVQPLSPRSPPGSAGSSTERALQSSPEPVKSDEESEFSKAKKDDAKATTSSQPQKPSDPLPFPDDDDDDDDDDEDSEEKSLANREARAARREAAAARRKEEVERRRREREEMMKMTKGELERQEQLKKEMEMERLRKEEQRRLRRLREEAEAEREEQEKEEGRRRKKLEEERERREKENYQRRLEDVRKEQDEEEARRRGLQLARAKEEELRRAEEEFMLSQMAEQERADYERRKREEAEARKRQEEEERRQRAEEAERAMAEARRLAQEMARKQAAMEARLRFNRSLRQEARSLNHSQDLNRAFVFSYLQLLQWLGLDLPQLDMAKTRRS